LKTYHKDVIGEVVEELQADSLLGTNKTW